VSTPASRRSLRQGKALGNEEGEGLGSGLCYEQMKEMEQGSTVFPPLARTGYKIILWGDADIVLCLSSRCGRSERCIDPTHLSSVRSKGRLIKRIHLDPEQKQKTRLGDVNKTYQKHVRCLGADF
jgi:hypothetical protein